MRNESLILAIGLGALCGCAPTYHTTEAWDTHKPKTILVLPPENTTSNTEVLEKAYPFLSTSLAMRGYYVVSPELALQTFQANKLNDPGQLNQLATQKFNDVFGVDAVMRTRVTDWSSKYIGITAWLDVGFDMELLDAKTGLVIWKWKQTLSESPNNGNQGLLGAVVNSAIFAATTPYEPLAAKNATSLMSTVPPGEYHVQE
jgi:hypothetical protein